MGVGLPPGLRGGVVRPLARRPARRRRAQHDVEAQVVGLHGLDDRVVLRPVRRPDRPPGSAASNPAGARVVESGPARSAFQVRNTRTRLTPSFSSVRSVPAVSVFSAAPGGEDRLRAGAVHRVGAAQPPCGLLEPELASTMTTSGHDGHEQHADACEQARREARSRVGGRSWQADDNNERLRPEVPALAASGLVSGRVVPRCGRRGQSESAVRVSQSRAAVSVDLSSPPGAAAAPPPAPPGRVRSDPRLARGRRRWS